MKPNNVVYRIRQRNFESAPCPFCEGKKRCVSALDCKSTVRLHHFTYAQVLELDIPMCRKCAERVAPVHHLSAVGAVIGGISGFLFMVNVSLFYAILFTLLMTALVYLLTRIILQWAFTVVYRQQSRVYGVYRTITEKYGWTTVVPDDIDYSKAPSVQEFEKMMSGLLAECDCEYI